MLTTKKLNNFEKRTEKMDEILNNQRSPNEKKGLRYNYGLKTIDTDKSRKGDEVNSRSYKNFFRSGINNQEDIEERQEHDKRSELRRGETSTNSFPTRYENN
jgi:hypothetical protein